MICQRRRLDLAFREINPQSADLNVHHPLLSPFCPLKTLFIVRKDSLWYSLKENSADSSQAVVNLLTVDVLPFVIVDRTVWLWIYSYNPLYHKGELKGKVLSAGLRKDQQTGERGIHFSLHQPSGRKSVSIVGTWHSLETWSVFLLKGSESVSASCLSQTVPWAQRHQRETSVAFNLGINVKIRIFGPDQTLAKLT